MPMLYAMVPSYSELRITRLLALAVLLCTFTAPLWAAENGFFDEDIQQVTTSPLRTTAVLNGSLLQQDTELLTPKGIINDVPPLTLTHTLTPTLDDGANALYSQSDAPGNER